jgi:ABC-type branched-subunit amino acid transport system substrate-binding protein
MRAGSWFVIALLALNGCGLVRPAVKAPPAPEPLPPLPPGEVPPRIEASQADESAELQQALGSYSISNPAPARAALEAFVDRHPSSPQRARAGALLARLDLSRGDPRAARVVLQAHARPSSADPIVLFVRGLLEARENQPRAALATLASFASDGPPPGFPEREEAELSLLAALGDARAANGDPAGGLSEWERYARHGAAREAERIYAGQRAEAIGARLAESAAAQLYQTAGSDFARAAVGLRAAAALRARGDAAGARRVEDDTARLRRSLGWSSEVTGVGPGDPHRLGLLAPFSGSAALLGEVVLRGAMLAIGDAAQGSEPLPFQIVARDAASGRDGVSERAALELVREEAAIALVGVGDRRAVGAAVRDGVPVLLLDEAPPGATSTGFQILHTPEIRATELARRALALGVRRFAILGPDHSTGQRLAEAFSRAVAAGGGRVTGRVTYPGGTNVFTTAVGQLRRASFESVFVADDASRLELVAPALAAGDIWPQPWSGATPAPRPPRAPGAAPRREVLLLSTAVGLTLQLLRNAGRYVQGALLAPGFFSDVDDPRSSRFVAQYRALYGQDPVATDAYGYDAFRLLTSAIDRGARSRSDLLQALGGGAFEGVTGTLRFGPDHTRVDAPPIYMVEGDTIRALR